jgi:hypothetical protein
MWYVSKEKSESAKTSALWLELGRVPCLQEVIEKEEF